MPNARSGPADDTQELEAKYLTTRQVAALLHVKERKIYELAAAGEIPGTRALGKWLFERTAIHAWLEGHQTDPEARRHAEPPNVVLGSHDPLLEWALRESGSGLASFLDGSLDGLERFARAEGIVTGLHVFDAESADWNLPAVRARFEGESAVLVEWAWRERGLVVADGNPLGIATVADLAGRRAVPRQGGAGSQVLFDHLLREAGIEDTAALFTHPARTEADAVLAVLEDQADVAFGLHCIARQFRLDFVPVMRERFDLLVRRRDWFEPPFQRLLEFTRSDAFAARVAMLTGYDVSGLGRVHFNGGPVGQRASYRPRD